MDEKSFYDLNYIIQINEERLEQYTTAYQKVLERLTHIILVYSAITIFLIPLIQDEALYKIRNPFFLIALICFLILLVISLIFTIRLILPIRVAYLTAPRKYYEEYRLNYEKTFHDQNQITNLLKASYIEELQQALATNETVFRSKSSFYYNALVYGLLSIVPYLVCLGFHLSFKEDNIQKVHIVNTGKNRNFMVTDSSLMGNTQENTTSTSTTTQTTNLPGIVTDQVIPSSPNLIKENSQYISNKEDSQHAPKIVKK